MGKFLCSCSIEVLVYSLTTCCLLYFYVHVCKSVTEVKVDCMIILLLLITSWIEINIAQHNKKVVLLVARLLWVQGFIMYLSAHICRQRHKVVKVENFFEVIVPSMMPKLFRRYFRMYEETMKSVISYLSHDEPHATLLDKGRVSRHKKVAMTCAFLGSNQTIVQ